MKKMIAILLTALLALGALVPAYADAPTDPTAPAAATTPTTITTTTPTTITLQRGSRSTDVIEVQTKLIELGYLKGRADGVFGPKTEQAVRDFQLAHGLTENGIFDADDFEQLASPDVKGRSTAGTYDNTPTSSSSKSGSKSTSKSGKSTHHSSRNTPNSPHTPDNSRDSH